MTHYNSLGKCGFRTRSDLVTCLLVLVSTIAQQQLVQQQAVVAFVPLLKHHPIQQNEQQKLHYNIATALYNKKPQRLDDNVDGIVYVNDRCINCAACAGFAPHIFRPSEHHPEAHIVYEPPETLADIVMTRAALAACPVAAIRLESYGERNHNRRIIATRNTVENQLQPPVETHSANGPDVTNNEQPTTISWWTEQDAWTLQQMTSKDLKRPFPRPFLLNEISEATDIHHEKGHSTVSTTAVPDVYWVGHHNEASFGAIPYLVRAEYENNTNVWIMVDVPKYNVQSVRDVTSITGPNGPHYLFMTHVDDTADHEQWANHFFRSSHNHSYTTTTTTSDHETPPTQQYCQRIFHAGDLGRYNWIGDTSLEQVPILLSSTQHDASLNRYDFESSTNGLVAYLLNGTCISDTNEHWLEQFEAGELRTDVIVLHTPGHSPGSCTLYKRRRTMSTNDIVPKDNDSDSTEAITTTIPGVLFTGDTYAYSGRHHRMTGFPRYGRNLIQQHHTLTQLITKLQSWDIIAPGHGLPRDYRHVSRAERIQELIEAQHDLKVTRRH